MYKATVHACLTGGPILQEIKNSFSTEEEFKNFGELGHLDICGGRTHFLFGPCRVGEFSHRFGGEWDDYG